jgi:integrase
MEQCLKSKCLHLYPFAMLALTTGARAGELQRIRWQDIDFESQRITIHKTKNGEKRSLFMLPFIVDVIKRHGQIRNIGTDLVFPAHHNLKQPFEYRTSWDHAKKMANLEDFRFHDLRHTAASYLAMSGSTLMELSTYLGHKTLNMVKRYSHISEQSTASAVQRMNERILRL